MVLTGEDDEADHQRDAAAEAVGQRALGDLADGEAGEPGGEGELRGAGGGAEGGLHGREGGQVHVGGGGADGDEQAEEGGQPGGVSGGTWVLIRGCLRLRVDGRRPRGALLRGEVRGNGVGSRGGWLGDGGGFWAAGLTGALTGVGVWL